MSVFHKWPTVPSESTLEQQGNHLILILLAPSPAWFFIPTQREEIGLGYDASLQNMKACVLQYKRARPLHGGGVSIKLSATQLATLTSRYQRGGSRTYSSVQLCTALTPSSAHLAAASASVKAQLFLSWRRITSLPTRLNSVLNQIHPPTNCGTVFEEQNGGWRITASSQWTATCS
jgi:hypothetical protein